MLGPQGTLYGAGTLGGAIRYIPRKPQFDDASVSARGTAFSLSESDSMGWRGGATFNVPFGDNLALRASIDRYDDPGFIDTPYLVRQAGVSDPEPNFADAAAVAANLLRRSTTSIPGRNESARVALRWQPGDIVDATVHLSLSADGRRRPHAEPPARLRHGALRVGDALSGAERADATSCCRPKSSPTSVSPS